MNLGLQLVIGSIGFAVLSSLLHFVFSLSWANAICIAIFVNLVQAALIDSEDRREFDGQP